MLVLRISQRCLLKFHSGIGINHSCNIDTKKILSAISHATQNIDTYTSCGSYRSFTHSSVKFNEQPPASDQAGKIGELTEYHAYDMVHKLSDNDRKALSNALSRFDAEKTKSQFKEKLAASNWRLKFARKGGEQLGSVDPTGSYCAMPDDWIKKKLAEAAVRPSNDALFKSKCYGLSICIKN